ncbi:MAG: sporulation integral membrane protein YlbJ, partial [Alicyclobacillus sp.]|nr:sporulation integral membrane protein YlbJ [Alicyclobacillus sp.]
LGVLLEPLMRPLFSVPGIGAFALSMGLAAGYPMDAVITARFRESKMCTRVEGERLLAFTNTADPLFMISAVAVGMFKAPVLGPLIAIAHYISAFIVGVSFKLWGRRSNEESVQEQAPQPGNLFVRAFREIARARQEDGRPFGKLLRESVTESMMTLFMICGFIVFFAVMIEILHLSGILALLGMPLRLVYHLMGVDPSLVNPTLAGLLEIDIGSAQAAVVNAPLLQRVAVVSGIIAWSGLAVHAQVASVITHTDIRMSPYFLARFAHGVLAAVLTIVLWGLGVGKAVSALGMQSVPAFSSLQALNHGSSWWMALLQGLTTWVWLLAVLLILSIGLYVIRRVRVVAWRVRVPADRV